MKHLFILLLLLFGMISFVSAEKQVNSWDIGFESDYYNKYITSQEISIIPVKIDFDKREHTLEFYIDNINERGMPNYVQISADENNSKVTLHIAGEYRNNARVISPEDYDPRIPYKVNYNNKRRIVINFIMPSDFSKDDTFEIGLRAKNSNGENRQLLLNLVSDYNLEKTSIDMTNLLIIIGSVVFGLIFLWFVFLRKKGGVKNESF